MRMSKYPGVSPLNVVNGSRLELIMEWCPSLFRQYIMWRTLYQEWYAAGDYEYSAMAAKRMIHILGGFDV